LLLILTTTTSGSADCVPAGQRHSDEGLSRTDASAFRDPAIIVAPHWKRVPSDEDNNVFRKVQAFVAGPRVKMQIMVKNSKKYAARGGWDFGDFTEDKPAKRSEPQNLIPCHEPV